MFFLNVHGIETVPIHKFSLHGASGIVKTVLILSVSLHVPPQYKNMQLIYLASLDCPSTYGCFSPYPNGLLLPYYSSDESQGEWVLRGARNVTFLDTMKSLSPWVIPKLWLWTDLLHSLTACLQPLALLHCVETPSGFPNKRELFCLSPPLKQNVCPEFLQLWNPGNIFYLWRIPVWLICQRQLKIPTNKNLYGNNLVNAIKKLKEWFI